MMDENELYKTLNEAGLDFDILEVFDNSVWVKFDIEKESKNG